MPIMGGMPVNPMMGRGGDLNRRISELAHKHVLHQRLKPHFDRIAGPSGRLNFQGAMQLFAQASMDLLGVPMGPQDFTEAEFMRFDFDGDGTMSFKEASKCFRYNMLEMQKRMGGQPAPPVPTKTPEQAGYQVLKVLASGGQGSTALANSARGQVALKIYDKNNENAGGIEELRAEMETMKSLAGNKHIMECIEIFQDSSHFYCVNELLPGGDLESLRENAMRSGIPLSERYFQVIFKQCVKALEFMHKNALMHCDIKEPNIMLKTKDYRNPVITLIDFGMAQRSAADGMAGGTPGYRPPETNETNIWFPRGDIFAMGVVFFQVLADMTPSEKKQKPGLFTAGAQSAEQVMMFVATRDPPFHIIARQYPGVMPWIVGMLMKNFRARPKAPQLLQLPWFRG